MSYEHKETKDHGMAQIGIAEPHLGARSGVRLAVKHLVAPDNVSKGEQLSVHLPC